MAANRYTFFDKSKPIPAYVENMSSENHRRYYQTVYAAQPVWANRADIRSIYKRATAMRERGSSAVVDHIVPLKHPMVCGLHTADNMQIVSESYNMMKSNKFWPDMPYEQGDMFSAFLEAETFCLG